MNSHLKHIILGLTVVGVVVWACYCQYKAESSPGNSPGIVSNSMVQVKEWLGYKKVENVELLCIYQKDAEKVQQDIQRINKVSVGFYDEIKIPECILKDDVSLADVKIKAMKMMNVTQDELVASSLSISISNDYRKGAFDIRKTGTESGYTVIAVRAMTRK